jgi:glycine/D-amino acid oxidase-like deaminating enzyme
MTTVFEEPQAPVLVCGFGIIGLATSLCLLPTGHPVIAIGARLPGDPLIATYTSTAAGAHHLSFAADDDKRQHDLDRTIFDVMWKQKVRLAGSCALYSTNFTAVRRRDTLRFSNHFPM